MSQHLTIRKFGPIDEVSIEVKDILIFIGPQASGKSTISKAIFFFKSLRDDLTSYLTQCYEQKNFVINPFADHPSDEFAEIAGQKFVKIYGSVLQFPDLYLEYQYGNGMKITVAYKKPKLFECSFDDFFKQKFSDFATRIEALHEGRESFNLKFASSREISTRKTREAMFFYNIIDEVNSLFNDDRDLLFLPAGRSLITILSQQRYNISLGDEPTSSKDRGSDKSIKIDYLMQYFIHRIDNTKPIFKQYFNDLIQESIAKSDNLEKKEAIELAKNLIKLILKGSYRYQDGIETLDFSDNKSTLINFASSGQQEVIWILLLVLLLIINQREVFLVVEEPEAHLFPVAQKQVIDLIALLANQNSNQIILTTHSPYILSSFNNLLYAYNLGQKKPEEVGRIVDRHFWIDPNRLDAYILEDGKARSIMDSEMRLINSAEIDRASDIIVNTFDKLFELEDAE